MRAIVPSILLVLTACTGVGGDIVGGDGANAPDGAPGPDVSPGPDAAPGPDADVRTVPQVSVDFVESSADVLDPERGYYVGYDLVAGGSAASVRSGGHSVAIALVNLQAYRTAPLDDALLASLARGFAAVRAAGVKVVLRFAYNDALAPDASKATILGHIAQLTPLLRQNADVITVLQAGFIGAWGEWHSSTNGLDNDVDRTDILNALLAALPSSRDVQVRTPMFKDAAFPGGPVDAASAFDGSGRSRVGHHDDCFLASDSDYGTYASPVSTWTAYVANDSRYTAVGGETCAVYPARTDCAPAIAEMAAHHWSFLNREYNQSVIDGWASQGCAGEIQMRLGYRFALDRVTIPAAVAPGGELALEIDLHNSGFAAPYNRRPVEIVLAAGASRQVVRLAGEDARRWAAGATTTLAVRLRVPADLAPGAYTLALRLPDDADALAADPRYAIRLANDGVWDAASGDNVLTRALSVDASAPGPRDATATAFVELP